MTNLPQVPSQMISIQEAVALLKSGDVVSIPTETVYGLAAAIDNELALKKIFEVKGRPFFDPLIVHVSSLEMANSLLKKPFGNISKKLIENFWPGPLTLVVKKNESVSELITSGLETVAIRWPQHDVAQQIVSLLGQPLAAPSANRFGKTSPSESKHVYTEFPFGLHIVEGGPCKVGIESTIVAVDDDSCVLTLLRPGIVSKADIGAALQNIPFQWLEAPKKITSPGQIDHHYMPESPLIFFNSLNFNSNSSQIDDLQSQMNLVHLKLNDNPILAARMLYSELRLKSEESKKLEKPNRPGAILFTLNELHRDEAWGAIIDRLYRASSIKIE